MKAVVATDFKQLAIELAASHNLKIVIAESLTGGMVASSLVNVPGASKAFLGGYVTYTNEMKTLMLNVSPQTLEKHGAVSAQTAAEMAKGAYLQTGADIALALTGNAGPTASENKPVGLVYMCIAFKGKIREYEMTLPPDDRNTLRINVASKALEELGKTVLAITRRMDQAKK